MTATAVLEPELIPPDDQGHARYINPPTDFRPITARRGATPSLLAPLAA